MQLIGTVSAMRKPRQFICAQRETCDREPMRDINPPIGLNAGQTRLGGDLACALYKTGVVLLHRNWATGVSESPLLAALESIS